MVAVTTMFILFLCCPLTCLLNRLTRGKLKRRTTTRRAVTRMSNVWVFMHALPLFFEGILKDGVPTQYTRSVCLME